MSRARNLFGHQRRPRRHPQMAMPALLRGGGVREPCRKHATRKALRQVFKWGCDPTVTYAMRDPTLACPISALRRRAFTLGPLRTSYSTSTITGRSHAPDAPWASGNYGKWPAQPWQG